MTMVDTLKQMLISQNDVMAILADGQLFRLGEIHFASLLTLARLLLLLLFFSLDQLSIGFQS